MPEKKNLKLEQLKVKSFVTRVGEKSGEIKGGAQALPYTEVCPQESLTDCRECLTGPTGCTDCTICYPCYPTMGDTCEETLCAVTICLPTACTC